MIEKLKRLSEIAPDMCRAVQNPPRDGDYKIGDYSFFFLDGKFFAVHRDTREVPAYVTGRPALAWLRDVLEVAIEARGWTLAVNSIPGISRVMTIGTFNKWTIGRGLSEDNPAEALLDALLEAVEGEG